MRTLCLLFLALPAWSADWRILHRVSVGVLLAGTTADAATSWQRPEQNRLLAGPDGRFGHRGLAIKLSLNGAMLAPQVRVRSDRGRKMATVINFAAGGVYGLVAARNARIR